MGIPALCPHEFEDRAGGGVRMDQNPAAGGQIPWDKPRVYAYYAQQGWSHDDVDTNIFDVYAEETTNHTAFDPTSIMEYAIPDSLTVGSYAIGWNTTLSQTDNCVGGCPLAPFIDPMIGVN